MMGHGHAVMGAAAWVTLTSPYLVGVGGLPSGQVAVGAIVTAGAALLPDADHHAATISRSLPPVSSLLVRGVVVLAGGHRQGTHSLIGIAAFTALAALLVIPRIAIAGNPSFQVGSWVLVLLLVAFAAKSLRLTRGWISCWAVAVATATGLAWFAPASLWWLPASVAVGVTSHILGDLLTEQGVALWWPWKQDRVALPLLGTAGSMREWVLVTGLYAYLLWFGVRPAVPSRLLEII
ncbi:MAG TPA: metal-dependent hydrolase [Jiangellaceae bacterium]|nr:metal-dependent hydrolase [Jiangellaceae bacterium]